MRRRAFLVGLVAVMLLAVPAAAALNFGGGGAPNPTIAGDVTKDTHQLDWDATQYEADDGSVTSLPATVNSSADNPFFFTATDINFTDAGAFPVNKDGVSALDASEWTTDASAGGSVTVSDVSTAPDVDALRVSTSSQTSGDSVSATFGNFSITSDAEKRYVQIAADVNTLDSAAVAELRLNDADGDYVAIDLANASAEQSDATVLANQTGEGHVIQEQIGGLTVEGSGDGTLSEIQNGEVVVNDGNAEVDVSALNAQKMGEWQFGAERVDNDGDDELETVDISEPHGQYSVHSLGSLGAAFDSATINDLTVPMLFEAEQLPSDDVMTNWTATTSYPAFDQIGEIHYRMDVPDAYDLSYSGLSLDQKTNWPSERYAAVEYKEGVGDTDFGDIENWDSKTSSFDAQDKTVEIDGTIQPGTESALHYELKLTDGEADEMQSSGGAGVMGGNQGGGFVGWLIGLPGVVLSAIGGALGIRRLQG